jgi:hypothetical protein
MKGELLPGPRWADLVFHVLAHVTGANRFASSLEHLPYRAFCEHHLGPAATRSLGEDVEHLSQVLTSHELLARLQWVAFLFEDASAAHAAGARELADLLADEAAGEAGVNPLALRALSGVEAQAEVLRAAAELEAPHHARLPEALVDVEALSGWLLRVSAAAPRLGTLEVRFSRALTRHGRVLSPLIYVGTPSVELGVEVSQVAVQAAHEATVIEVAEAARSGGIHLGERDVEYAALVVFAERAALAGLGEEHGRWWSALEAPPLAEMRKALGSGGQRVRSRLLAGR